MTARVLLPLVLALGLVLGWALWVRAPEPIAREVVDDAGRPAEAEILARLARMEAALAKLTGAGLAAAPAPSTLPVPGPFEARRAEEPSLPPPTAADLAPLEAQMAALARAVEALQQVVGSGESPAKFPDLELLRSAPEPNWEQLDLLADLQASERFEDLTARVHWMSQEEVLAKYGRPDGINPDGSWYYDGSRPGHHMQFMFTSDYVSYVRVF